MWLSNDELLDELLSKPTGPAVASRRVKPGDFTKRVDIARGSAEIEVAIPESEANEGTALRFLEDEGLSSDDWEVTHFRKIEYGQGLQSVRFSYKRRQTPVSAAVDAADLLVDLEHYDPVFVRQTGSHGFLVLLGDMQFGKADKDGPAGTVGRTITAINRAADRFAAYSQLYDLGHVHVAWLGDHVEGFVSQGGANVWRTSLTLTEQIRLTRRVMLHALKTFAPLASKVTMAAVPGNHGETVRFEGTGITRYDDSHDTESLIAVKDVADMMPEKFGHVEFFVPDNDELIVVTEVAGTVVAHHHGHKFGSRKDGHWLWWQGQAFNEDSPMHMANLLVAGHLHHEFIDTRGKRTFIQVPALESESTWFRHLTGVGGCPGAMVAITKGGETPLKEVIHCD